MSREDILKLTSLCACAGWASKLSQKALTQVLRRLPRVLDRHLLVGAATADDAGVYQIDRDRALVQTVDFFTPIVDDPFLYGQIAAANSLSDVYAMGGRPLTAMNLVGTPTDRLPAPILNAILRGGAAKVKEAGCVLVGGHTTRNPEPFYGLAVTGLVSPRRMITNADAQPGDLLVLTKPLGSGIISTGIKRGLTSAALARRAANIMRRLNRYGAELAEKKLVCAGTDITGYGLLGHLGSLCRASRVGAEIRASAVPVMSPEVFALMREDCVPGGTRQNLELANTRTDWGATTEEQKLLLTDAQTSGGLLLCVAPRRLAEVQRLLVKDGAPAMAVVGRIIRLGRPVIRVLP